MTPATAQRRARARRALRQYQRLARGPREEIGYPPPGLLRRLVNRWLDRRNGGQCPF